MGRFILIYQLTVHRCVCVHCSSFFHGPTVPSFFAKLKIPTYSKHKPSKKTIQTDCKRSVYVTCCYSFTLHPLQINFENKPPFSLLKFHSPSIHPKQKTYNQPNKPIGNSSDPNLGQFGTPCCVAARSTVKTSQFPRTELWWIVKPWSSPRCSTRCCGAFTGAWGRPFRWNLGVGNSLEQFEK